MRNNNSFYTPEFYQQAEPGSASSAAVAVPILDELTHPSTVLDVGCGTGAWLREWAERGITVAGVDGEYVAHHLIWPFDFTGHDLRQPLDLGRRFDLVTCLEVAEHLPKRTAHQLVGTLCAHGDVVAFSAAVPGQGGVNHINEQWPSWWARRFAAFGYKPYDLIRDQIWWDQRIEWWYRQNLIIFATDRAAEHAGWSTRKPPPCRSLDLAWPGLVMPELATRLDATVCIPWRPTPSRLAAYERVRQFWSMFGWSVITADSATKIFSLAQARNNAVAKATTDVVVIADADTLLDPLNVLRAVADPRGVWWPFNRYRILSPEYLDTPLAELVNTPYINTWDGKGVNGVGGCLVTTTKEYWRLGGQPPEFEGWGWEDTAFTAIVATLSKVRRLHGHAYAFEHNTHAERYEGGVADSEGWTRDRDRNLNLMGIYITAQGRPWLMREVIKQRDERRASLTDGPA